MSTLSGGSHVSADQDPYRKAKYLHGAISRRLVTLSVINLIGFILLVVGFSSPYWLSSYSITYSEFKRAGLWDFCFDNYRHPSYQYDEKFTGCHWIYSPVYQNIRDWLQPGWFMFVQAMVTLSLISSTVALAGLAIILMYYMVTYQFVLLLSIAALQSLSAILLLIGLTTFRVWCYDRSWLMYPSFNYLDWAYYATVLGAIFFAVGALGLFRESSDVRRRMRKAKTLIYNMQPRTPPTPAYRDSDYGSHRSPYRSTPTSHGHPGSRNGHGTQLFTTV